MGIPSGIIGDVKGLNVLIIGWPASGKTVLSDSLVGDHYRIHTDDYIDKDKDNYKESLYTIMADMKAIERATMIEGIQGYRLLRKGVQLNCYYPDAVIELKIKVETMIQRYEESRKGKDVQSAINWGAMHDTILEDYRKMYNVRKPKVWITIQND